MKCTYTAVLHEDGGKVYARVSDLDGCVTTGTDFSDAVDQITDAMAAWLCTAGDAAIPIPLPQPTPQSRIVHDGNEVLTLVRADTVQYRAQTDARAVRKNVSLPAWLAKISDRRRINCSQVLQDALMARIEQFMTQLS